MPDAGGFFTRRWRAEVPLHLLFWRDMLLVGSLINVLLTGVALALVAAGGSVALAAAVHFSPLPFNLFLVASVWRLPAGGALRWASLVWLVAVTLV
ncbi:MAG: hypothetical protein QUV35_12675 [Hydrogenophaga sp.]|uniref:hypothetical protein n=1 Tax=Hydrogenophaga sp. TaxID=1904254 RepID=UPI0026316F60|nr:hypothetical protein [Hydrogenophaga sp.]MDM7943472.1 hypothetical protein [Hydrogenophaga sp.]